MICFFLKAIGLNVVNARVFVILWFLVRKKQGHKQILKHPKQYNHIIGVNLSITFL